MFALKEAVILRGFFYNRGVFFFTFWIIKRQDFTMCHALPLSAAPAQRAAQTHVGRCTAQPHLRSQLYASLDAFE
jgi:hypothetical protein